MDSKIVISALKLRSGELAKAWFSQLEEVGPPPEPVRLPQGDDARDLLRQLGVPELDAEEIVAATPDPDRDPELWWLLERTHHTIVRHMGDWTVKLRPGPSLSYELGDTARYFYVYVFLATIPAVRDFHAKRGIPEAIAWETLTQLGEMVAIHRRKFGGGGMNMQWWLALHLRGLMYRLGRFQYTLAAESDGTPYLDLTVPEVGGSLTPEICDDSMRRARPFFDQYFPEHGAKVAAGRSWMLDPALAEYLDAESNILQFARQWTLIESEHDPNDPAMMGDAAALEFVFRYNGQPLDELPQRTALEKAVVAHLKAGRHWHVRTACIQLP